MFHSRKEHALRLHSPISMPGTLKRECGRGCCARGRRPTTSLLVEFESHSPGAITFEKQDYAPNFQNRISNFQPLPQNTASQDSITYPWEDTEGYIYPPYCNNTLDLPYCVNQEHQLTKPDELETFLQSSLSNEAAHNTILGLDAANWVCSTYSLNSCPWEGLQDGFPLDVPQSSSDLVDENFPALSDEEQSAADNLKGLDSSSIVLNEVLEQSTPMMSNGLAQVHLPSLESTVPDDACKVKAPLTIHGKRKRGLLKDLSIIISDSDFENFLPESKLVRVAQSERRQTSRRSPAALSTWHESKGRGYERLHSTRNSSIEPEFASRPYFTHAHKTAAGPQEQSNLSRVPKDRTKSTHGGALLAEPCEEAGDMHRPFQDIFQSFLRVIQPQEKGSFLDSRDGTSSFGVSPRPYPKSCYLDKPLGFVESHLNMASPSGEGRKLEANEWNTHHWSFSEGFQQEDMFFEHQIQATTAKVTPLVHTWGSNICKSL